MKCLFVHPASKETPVPSFPGCVSHTAHGMGEHYVGMSTGVCL